MNRDAAESGTVALPGPNVERWVEFHHEHTTPNEYSYEFARDMTAEADGLLIIDVDGNVLLDFTCHIGTAPLGYNNEKVLSKLREFDLAESMKIVGQDIYFRTGPDPKTAKFPEVSHLMDKPTDVSSHYGMGTVLLSNPEAETVENVMRMTHDHEALAKYSYIFEGSFHGRTLGMLSLTKSKEVYTRHYPQIAGIETVPFYADSGCSGDDDACDCGSLTGDSSRLRNSLSPKGDHINPDEVAFAVPGPIQGVGGYRFPNEAFMTEVNDACGTYDIPFVVDEIRLGVGRTGEMRAADHYPIEPSVIASAKGLRVGAIVSRADMFPTKKNRLGSTFSGGDLLASMQGVFTLDVIEEYDLLDNAIERSRQAMELFVDDVPDHVVDVCSKGLMLAVGFDTKKRRSAVVEAALGRGLLTLGCGEKTTHLLPPSDFTKRRVKLDVGILCEAVDAAATEAVA